LANGQQQPGHEVRARGGSAAPKARAPPHLRSGGRSPRRNHQHHLAKKKKMARSKYQKKNVLADGQVKFLFVYLYNV
jgi:hypothetical protein